ncbi:TetR/AcrR family transcriptional regulator [Nonomuraea sp. NPDC050663]|uniref:TetR/AcrR family transcriptional regulator n=1 Tax=Nonomuraea sp. NPDC050663 TaxID=3364370 RepID=UPI0037BD857A
MAQRYSELTREAILRGAAATLRTDPAAGMAEIATAAGIGRATLYRYFATREELLAELARFSASESLRVLAEAGVDSPNLPLPETLARAVRALLTTGRAYWALSPRHASLWPEEEQVGWWIQEFVARAQEAGSLRTDIPADQLGALLGTLIAGSLTYEPLVSLGVEDAASAIVTLFLTGAASPEKAD